MAETLKQRLLKSGDNQTQKVPLEGLGDVVIRRLKLKERNEIAGLVKGNDAQASLVLTRMIIARAMIDPVLTPEEVDELPVTIADILATAIMKFNGWSKEGANEVSDHFRPTSGN